jgi:hypothetical protein
VVAVTKSREIIDELHANELAVLREERDLALADLKSTRRECEILRGAMPGVGAKVGYELARPKELRSEQDHDAAEERMAMLEHAVRALDAALFDITIREDCFCEGDYRSTDDTNVCTLCTAKHALKLVADWRYDGSGGGRPEKNRHRSSYPDRTIEGGHYPREAKMHAAWAKAVDDFRLADILRDKRPAPSARDWYVATSVVQWLATSCGMAILEAAGFKYTQYDEDHETYRASRASEQGAHP